MSFLSWIGHATELAIWIDDKMLAFTVSTVKGTCRALCLNASVFFVICVV